MTTAKSLKHICRKIVAIGRNYRGHIIELRNKPEDNPVVFLKAATSLIDVGEPIKVLIFNNLISILIPDDAQELHHEVELGIVVGNSLKNATPEEVQSSILGYVVAVDMTDRTLQNYLKARQLPWTLSKSFDTSCPVSPILSPSIFPNNWLLSTENMTSQLWLRVNQEDRQRACLDQMLWTPAEIICFISKRMRLEPGDLVLTGTPSGVGAVRSGDLITAGLDDICQIEFKVI